MASLRKINRTATFAWSPGSQLPLIATGTRAGAVDADFSDETQLELWNLALDDFEHGVELQPAASISTDSRFHDIAWGRITDDHKRGIIAGALENGALDLWDADQLLNGSSTSHMSRTTKHSGSIKTLQFNPFRSELLATAGAKGELFISDLNNVANPFRLGNVAARADDFESLDWNKKVPHILVTGSSGGFVTVWDVKAKKESLTLNNLGRKAVSAVAWDPDRPTKLATAIPNDTDPLILVWDLRNSNAPERTLRAHEQGVLSLSWCPLDSDLLLSCGKDNRTICWNAQSGQPLGEFPIVTNWTFETRWNPHNPSLLATASFDGKIAIHSVQNTRPEQSPATSQNQALDGEDFFAKAQIEPQGSSFSLQKAPKWLERPVGASFGFGGKIVSFGIADTQSASRKSKLQISSFVVDTNIGTATESFEKALVEGNLKDICESRKAAAKSNGAKADWEVIETLITPNPRKALVDSLGFSESEEAADGISRLTVEENGDKEEENLQVNGNTKSNRLSSFFENNPDADTFLSDLAATKGAKTNNPFKIFTGSESDTDRQITRALLLGQFDHALDVCLKEDRMSDAFMIAICGGQKCIDKAQAAYFSNKSKGPNYLRLLASVVGKNLWDIVHNADLEDWKEVLATLCTYADENEFSDLCESLGDRLEELVKGNNDSVETHPHSRRDAAFCYMAGSKLEKVVTIWIDELNEQERSALKDTNGSSGFSVHAEALQQFIEKVTIFREVTKFEDNERNASSNWKLASLYDMYSEYADVVAAHGQLSVAEKYLELLPAQYPAAEVARNRVKQASRKANAQSAGRQGSVASVKATPRPQPAFGGYQPNQAPSIGLNTAPPAGPYGPTAPSQNPYAPATTPGFSPVGYTPSSQAVPPASTIPPPPQYGGYGQPPVGPPPRSFNASPSILPPSKATNMTNWNDTPMVTKPPPSRRSTPAVAGGAASAFTPQSNVISSPPIGTPFATQQRATPPLPPPPKGSGPSRVTSPNAVPSVQPYQQPERPLSAAANVYAPPPPSAPAQGNMASPMPSIPRGPSPYNAPPAGPPRSNRYAPSPAAQPATLPPQTTNTLPPPPSGLRSGPPQMNPYAPQQTQPLPPANIPGPFSPNAPPQHQVPPNTLTQGPPEASVSGPSQPKPPVAALSAPKYPSGDRSHIPSNAQPLYEILNRDMQRVKAKAPSSYKAQVNDTEKRLNILFDHLNNEDLLKSDTIQSLTNLVQAMQAKNYEEAQAIQADIHRTKTEECGNWMVGVKRLIGMSRATP